MIKADNTQKRCFVACDEQTKKDGRCSCHSNTHQALQLQQTGVMQRYFHPFVGAGTLIKETEKSLVIKLDFNGKEYFAPKHEFTELL